MEKGKDVVPEPSSLTSGPWNPVLIIETSKASMKKLNKLNDPFVSSRLWVGGLGRSEHTMHSGTEGQLGKLPAQGVPGQQVLVRGRWEAM